MFHFYLNTAYIIPNIYVFFRIMFLLIGKKYRLLYAVIYLLVASLYPIAESFDDADMNLLVKTLSDVSGYLLPFFLYLFLFTVLLDLFLLFNMASRLVSSEKRKSFRFRLYTLSAIIILSSLVVVAGVVNLNTIRTSFYQIEIPRKESTIDRLRIAFVADFHLQKESDLEFVEQFVRKVSRIQPDLLLYGGDIVEGRRQEGMNGNIALALKSIQANYGTFGVLGNHDGMGGYEDSFFQKAGIILLNDTLVNIGNAFYLAGRLDERFTGRKPLQEILGDISVQLPVILMDHRPTRLQEVSRLPVDLQFSGHTHHGQMFPLNLIISQMYELSWGHKKIRNTHFFVTSGLRLWGPPVKTAGKSEIMVVDVYFGRDKRSASE